MHSLPLPFHYLEGPLDAIQLRPWSQKGLRLAVRCRLMVRCSI